ncbi:uncharacterized protein LOC128548528 isoform X2 [Mercenaria mercenaria]|uniref:uncharacterized protein LOC128548528 isoform X2 n=1 Tax=Mercenaria mercenaria TaxID=6596 RepID=UPI00234F30F6|nr:uncharacterized protein LOC128548528 isoform X2 [Mercenaria mercenaria]
MKKRNKAHRDSTEPVKNLTESWILKVNEGCVQEKVDKTYEALIERLNGVGLYEPIDLCDIESLDKEVRRKWLNNMKLPFPVTQFTYRYGNYLGNLNMVWKIPQDIRDRKSSVECQLVKDTLNQISLYKTRRMHKDFIARYRMFAKPVILRNMFQFLTEYEYTPESSEQSQIDLRFCECLLESEDTELIFDLRKHNGRPLTEEFDSFWSELHKYLEEKTVVHERRHSDINYMPFAMSVENLREIIQDRLPAGAKIPSVSWLKLNFCPSNPYKNSSANYTGRFKVKFKVQQRLLRAQHEDNEYGRNLFGHLKEFACMFREDTLFQSLDDKAIVPVGEPAHAISTGVRIHHGGLVTGDRQNLAMDHDFHIAGIVPSVCFMINIPTSHNDSFYNGLVHVTVKDKVFEASSPLRHSTETISLLRGQYSSDDVSLEKPILIRYTDGGPDHRVTYRSVQICSLVEFVALDLDMLVCARTAPSMSYLNPAERTMSLLNIGLQNVALQRDKMSPEFEMIAKGKSLKGLRNVAERNDKFKEQYSESTKVPITVIKQRFSKLKWKGENIIIHDATTEEEMETMIKSILMVLDENVTIDMKNLTKLKSIRIDQFLARHARCRHYIFQIKKCGQDDCAYCVLNPPRLSPDVFEKLHFVPDPTCDNNTYKSFGDLYGTETDDTGRPSLAHKPQMTDRDKKFKKLLVGTKVRGFVDCCECGKRQVVYSDKRLNPQEETVLKRVQEELMFVCGSVLFPGGRYQDTIVVKEGQCCNSPIEVTYYAGKTMVFDPICFHCGDIDVADTDAIRQLKEQFGIVRPICNTCLETGKTVVTRNALKVKKKRN